jgi:LacI family transcriptional regulator
LVIPDLLNAYYTALADTASQILSQQGYHLILSATRDDPATEEATIYDMIQQAVDGLIWVPSSPDEQLLSFLREQGTPAVTIVRRMPDSDMDTIVFEDQAGSEVATRHLIDLGHRRIGYIGGDVDHCSNYDRWQGFLKAQREAGIDIDEDLIKLGTVKSMWGTVATPDLLNLPEPPTALYVASNGLMPGVMRVLRQYGIRIPDQISLICFDDVDWFTYSVPPITAIRAGHEKLAEMAVDLLMTRVQEAAKPGRRPVFLTIDSELVLRSSTGPPRQERLSLAASGGEEDRGLS